MRARSSLLFLACCLGSSTLVVLACGGDDTPPKFFDSGTDAADATTAPDVDAGGDAKVIVVNASADLGPIRMCFAFGLQNDGSDAVVAPVTPMTTAPIGAGAGTLLPDLGDLSLKAVTPYAMLAQSIGTSSQTCDSLVQVLAANKDYFVLPTIKNGTFADGSTQLLAITGCMRTAVDPAADATACGASYNPSSGNLVGTPFKLDQVVANSQRFGAQFVHAASAADSVWFAAYGTHGVDALLRPFDGGADEIIASSTTYLTLTPNFAASLAMPIIDQTSLVVSTDSADAGGATTIPLPLVYEATTGQATGENSYFVAGANYTFVLVGDPRASPTLDGGILNGFALHALAFPNTP